MHLAYDVIGIAQSKMATIYVAMCQNLKIFLVDLHLKTLATELKQIK